MVAALRSGEIDSAHARARRRVRPAPGGRRRSTTVEGNQGGVRRVRAQRRRRPQEGPSRRSRTRSCARRSRTRSTSRRSSTASQRGLGEPADTMSPSANPAWMPEIPDDEQFDFDLDKANALLDEAGYEDTDGDGVREMPGGGQPLQHALRGALREPRLAADRRVHHRLAEGDRDRDDAEGLRRRPAHRGDRQGRLRHVRVGLDAVRRPGPDAVVLHLRPGRAGPRRPDRTTTTTRTSATRSTTSSTSSRRSSSTPTSGWRSCTRCSTRFYEHGVYVALYTYPRPAGLPDRPVRGLGARSRRRPGPVLFSNTSPSYATLKPCRRRTGGRGAAAAAADDGGGGGAG